MKRMAVDRFGRWLAIAAVVMAAAGLGATPVRAQQQEMLRQIEQLQKDLQLLQRYVYRGETPPGGTAPTGSLTPPAGESTAMARQTLRVQQLEETIRQLTGQLEEYDFRIRQIQARLDKLVGDVDSRLTAIENRLGAGPAAAAPAPDSPRSAIAPIPATPQAPARASDALMQPGQQVLGTLTPEELPAAAPTPEAPALVLPEGSPQERYNFAFSFLRRNQYDDAEQALRAFLDAHGKDDLAANATYWLGETYYVRERWEEAIAVFADGADRFAKSDKAPDMVLKLGMSLGNLGRIDQACQSFAYILDNLPDAPENLRRKAEKEAARRGCGR